MLGIYVIISGVALLYVAGIGGLRHRRYEEIWPFLVPMFLHNRVKSSYCSITPGYSLTPLKSCLRRVTWCQKTAERYNGTIRFLLVWWCHSLDQFARKWIRKSVRLLSVYKSRIQTHGVFSADADLRTLTPLCVCLQQCKISLLVMSYKT